MHTAASLCAIRTICAVAAGFDLDSIGDLRGRWMLDVPRWEDGGRNAALSCRVDGLARTQGSDIEVDVEKVMDPLPRGSFGWWVLQCLTDEVTAVALPSDTGLGARVGIILITYVSHAGLW